jgi:hypothetical protein
MGQHLRKAFGEVQASGLIHFQGQLGGQPKRQVGVGAT